MEMETASNHLPSVRAEGSSVDERTETDEEKEEEAEVTTADRDGSTLVPPTSSSIAQAIRARKLKILQTFREPRGPAGPESNNDLEIFDKARDREAFKTTEEGGNGLVLSEVRFQEIEGSDADALDGPVDAGSEQISLATRVPTRCLSAVTNKGALVYLIEWTDEERIEPCKECGFPEKVLMCICSPSNSIRSSSTPVSEAE